MKNKEGPPFTPLGQFTVSASRLIVSNPCYELAMVHAGCSVIIDKPVPGAWMASLQMGKDGYVTVLVATAVGHTLNARRLSKQAGIVGVDSGQVGVFDADRYHSDGDEYERCCEFSLSNAEGGAFEYGAVSSSGYGDGAYECYAEINKKGQVIAVVIPYTEDGYEAVGLNEKR